MIACTLCGYTNPETARLCAHCATELSNRCDRCAFENPIGFKFCGECGLRLGARPVEGATHADGLHQRLRDWMPEAFAEKIAAERGARSGERREVSVLFLDLQGFTRYSEQRDPESVWERIDHYLRALVGVIYEFEGSIDKFTGDGLMALFGVPVAHGNDPERACRAALEMHRTIERINEEFRAQGADEGLRARIGIHTGVAVAGRIGPDLRMEYTVVGDAVNVASRLESEAPPGGTLIGEETYRRIETIFLGEELGGIALKGREGHVGCWRLDGLAKGLSPRKTQPLLPLTGRELELEQLALVAEKTRLGEGQIVLLSGEAGIGKSRLLREWRETLNPQIYSVVEGASLSYRQPISYWPFIQILNTLFGIQEDDPAATRWQRLEEGLREKAPEIAPSELLPFLGHMLSLPMTNPATARQLQRMAPPQLRQQSFIALRALLATIAFQHPLFLILEDLHWADSATLDLLFFLLGKSERLPLTFVLVTRPREGPVIERIEKMAARFEGRLTRLSLRPLRDTSMGRLVEAWLVPEEGQKAGEQGAPLPGRLRSRLLRQAAGNPFFLEEMLVTWAGSGDLVRDDGRWRLSARLRAEGESVPPTITALLTARLDQLDEDARRVLQLASVVGRSFPGSLLAEVAARQSEALDLSAGIAALEQVGLIRRNDGDGAPVEWSFRHPLVRDTVYQQLLLSERRQLHGIVARSMERLFQEGGELPIEAGSRGQQAELIVYHYEQATEWERGLPYLLMATEAAAERFDNPTALHYGRRALELVEFGYLTTAQRLRLHELLADLFVRVRKLVQAEHHYRAAIQTINDPELWERRHSAELHRKLARLHERAGRYEEAFRGLRAALEQLEGDEDEELAHERAAIYNDLGWVYYRRGRPEDLERAQKLAYRSLRLLAGSDRVHDRASAFNRLVVTYAAQGRWEAAEGFALKSLELRRSIGYQPGVAASCLQLTELLAYHGRWSDALDYARQSLSIARAISARESECEARIWQSRLLIYQGELLKARATTEAARTVAESINQSELLFKCEALTAELTLAEGRENEAHLHALQALEWAKQCADEELEATAHVLHARAWLARGRPEQALDEANQALARTADRSLPRVEGQARRVAGRALLAMDELDRARRMLRRAGQTFARLNLHYDLALTELHVATLLRAMGRHDPARAACARAQRTLDQLGARRDADTARALRAGWYNRPDTTPVERVNP